MITRVERATSESHQRVCIHKDTCDVINVKHSVDVIINCVLKRVRGTDSTSVTHLEDILRRTRELFTFTHGNTKITDTSFSRICESCYSD